MRITYLHQYFNTPSMPGSTRSFEMARRLVAMGHEVNMLTSWREHDGRKGWFFTEEAGIKVHWLPVPYSNHMSYKQRIKAFLKFALRTMLKAGSIPTDIIFATSTPLTIALPGVYASIWQKVPMVFEVRDLWPEMPIAMGALKNPLQISAAKKLESWAYYHAASIVALSPGMKQGVVNSGYSAEQVAVIPNSSDIGIFSIDPGVVHSFWTKRSWLDDRPLLIYAGAFGRVNGVDYAVELAKALLLLKSDIRILLVGDGSEREEVIHRAHDACVYERNLFFENEMPKSEVTALFSAASMASTLFIDLPEMRINSANKFFDTLAAGKPVLINYGGWMHELITQFKCGLSGWKRPIDEVAKELDLCLHDHEWLEKAGKAARHLAETHFDRNLLAQQLEKVIIATKEGNSTLAQIIAPGIYDDQTPL